MGSMHNRWTSLKIPLVGVIPFPKTTTLCYSLIIYYYLLLIIIVNQYAQNYGLKTNQTISI